MNLYGKEYEFLYTTATSIKVEAICPGKDINRLPELMGAGYSTQNETCAQIVAWMSESYERNKWFYDRDHKIEPLTKEMVLELPVKEYNELVAYAFRKIKTDQKPTVEAEPQKKEEEELR